MDKNRIFLILGLLVLIIGMGIIFTTQVEDDRDHLSVVATMYALGYMAEEIGGEKVEVELLIPQNTELHTWSPSASDVLKASRADVLIYNGAGLEPWVERSLLPSIDTSNMAVVETSRGLDLASSYEHDLSRLFIFDNDNSRTLVYDLTEHDAVLVTTLPFGLDATKHSGYFDNAPNARNSYGDLYIFVPNHDNITVIDSGLHGDHFHTPRIVTSVDAEMPRHYDISPDGRYIAFALDNEQKVLVMNIDNPGIHNKYDDGGAGSTSHATVKFDEDGLLYIGEMNTPEGENLRIIQASNGNIVAEGTAGDSPHGGVYSELTGKVYFNARDNTHGLVKIGSSGFEGLIPYDHEGNHLSRSWISVDGSQLISYVGDSAQGLEYSRIVVYDLVNEELEKEISVEVPRVSSDHGWPNSVFVESRNMVAISNPTNGTVVCVDIESESVDEISLDGDFPQAMRIIEDEDKETLWAVTPDGIVHLVSLDQKRVIDQWELEDPPGSNNVLALVPVEKSDHKDHDHELYDPHTWISPYLAMQQGQNIYEALVEKDPDNEEYYTQRWNQLKDRLIELDNRYMNELASAEKDYIFVSHEAYGYLADRYGFHQAGVIGISADQQPSSSAISSLVNRMIESETYVLYLDPIYSDAYVRTLQNNVEKISGQEVEVETLYLMTGELDGMDYLDQMEYNLEVLKKGLQTN
ncbi:metal ABC transporter solute-binding protein, Zn/Mn family [Methanosalsum zhilinae]|nr:zinc ABC transporter substrate-binding protein [Methanosalsum zhilinae]